VKRFLIVTADDFGLHESVNDAVEQASRAGILTAASLMVSGPAAGDAVRRARALPSLRVGLHLVLADGAATLAPGLIPGLADRDGWMNGHMFRRGVRYFALPGVRRQLEAEIRAQYSAFARTGLALDHVNVHKHFHLHPTILEILLRVGRDHGLAAVRVPHEPVWFAARAGNWSSVAGAASLATWISLMKRRLREAKVLHNDRVFGIAASGAMDESRLLGILERLPPGLTEVYLHPATRSGAAIARSMHGYRHADELAALVSPRVVAAADLAANRGGYADAARLLSGNGDPA
jgi:hopanoid biosynthesis associated protein HpnK